MRSVNKVILLGNIGKDAETKFLPSGVSVSKLSLATTRRTKERDEWKEVTDWHNCVVWKSENLSNFLTKGARVYLEGRIECRSYEDRDGVKKYVTEIVCEANNVVLLGGGERAADSQPQARKASLAGGIADDDIPFMRLNLPCL